MPWQGARRVAHLVIFQGPYWNALFHTDFKIRETRFEELADVHAFTLPIGTAVTNIYQIEMKKIKEYVFYIML